MDRTSTMEDAEGLLRIVREAREYERRESADLVNEASRPELLQTTLERLLRLEAADVHAALDHAMRLVAAALRADTIDVFTYVADDDALVARDPDGARDMPAADCTDGGSARAATQERLPLARGGRLVDVYRTGRSWLDGHAERDGRERGSSDATRGALSQLLCPIATNGSCLGVLRVASAKAANFSEDDLSFAEAVARWMALILHNAALAEELAGYNERRERFATPEQHLAQLTGRQREVAALIAGGLTNDEIARKLVLTPGTIANHVEHILRQLQFSGRVEVATLMTELGLHRTGT